jgi:hypothetical protein
MVMSCRLNDRETGVQFSVKARYTPVDHGNQTCFGAYPVIGHQGPFSGTVYLTTYLLLMQRIGMRGATPPLPRVFTAWGLIKQRDNFTYRDIHVQRVLYCKWSDVPGQFSQRNPQLTP